MCGFKKSCLFGFAKIAIAKLLGAGVLRNCFGSLADCVLRKFPWEQKTHRSLDFTRGEGLVLDESRSFAREFLEKIVDEGVHDAHRLGRNSHVGVHLLQNTVDVSTVGLSSCSSSFPSILLSTLPALLRATLLRRWGLFVSLSCTPGRSKIDRGKEHYLDNTLIIP